MIYELCEKIGIPKDGAEHLEESLSVILSNKECAQLLFETRDELMSGCREYEKKLREISEKSGVHMYTTGLAFMLFSATSLKYVYDAKKLPEEIYYDSMRDLSYKYRECINVYGIHGIFTYLWFQRFFTLKLFALGRLEYGINEFIYDSYTTKNGKHTLKRGDRVFDCHIPSSGKFPPEEVIASLKKAYRFFVDIGVHKDGELLPVTCHSYLLYPENRQIFREGSNIRSFADLFEIVPESIRKEENNPNFWRIFNKDYDGNLKDIPRDTSLRKNFAEYIENGGSMGTAYGVIYFDGEKIVD